MYRYCTSFALNLAFIKTLPVEDSCEVFGIAPSLDRIVKSRAACQLHASIVRALGKERAAGGGGGREPRGGTERPP